MIAERLQKALDIWLEGGRGEQDLLRGWEYMRVYCWLYSKTGAQTFANPLVKEYFKASQQRFGGAEYNQLLEEHSFCAICGTAYRVENLHICTECDHCYCYRCGQEKFPRNEYGNLQCGCGGILVG
jgi:hypothetical protein